MNRKQFIPWKIMLMLLPTLLAGVFTSCDDEEDSKTAPVVTTGTLTDITTTTAGVSGQIADHGNVEVTATGFVYSSVVSEPTLADDKVELNDTDGDFSATLEGLTSGTTYHVRAYATNNVGTGYGAVVDFTTGNAAPTATNVSISGTVEANMEVTATYTYNDNEGDAEGTTSFQWYVADDGTGTNKTAVDGATANIYTISTDYEDKFIAVGITPIATTGNNTGEEVMSAYFGVGEATTVTFTYNGEEVTYGIITSAKTGRKWLDRNLGASSVPSAVDDFSNYGDLVQWGRLDDGHQVITRTGPNDADATGVNGTTTERSTSDNPGHSQFIISPSTSSTGGEGFDWRTPQNHNLWQGVDRINNPCPSGWHIPTQEEWAAENIASISGGFTKLNITRSGFRVNSTGNISSSTTGGFYWSSTIGNDNDNNPENAIRIRFNSDSYNELSTSRSGGYACRCIND